MPVISGATLQTTTTVQQIIDGAAQDVRQVLSSGSTSDQAILMDYVNRVCLEILRASAWDFLLSKPQSFVTQMGVNYYWIGYAGGNNYRQFDTGLGIQDLRTIKADEVYDRTNFVKLFQVQAPPLAAVLEYNDGSARPGRPKFWRYTQDVPYVLSIFPAPDNQSTYTPIPEAPIALANESGGTLPARFYYIKATFVDSFGNEGQASYETKLFIPENMLATVNPPQPPPAASSTGIQYDRYNLYIGIESNAEVFQTGPLSTNEPWTEPTGGIATSGNPPPTSSALEPIDGYLIQFRYYKSRLQITDFSQVIQVPDDYKDVVISGVNWLVNEYLRRPGDAKIWEDIYMRGVQAIRRDQNMYPRRDFIATDPATVNTNFPAVEVTDPSITRTN